MLTDKQRAQTAARQQRFRERQAQVRCAEQMAKGLPALPSIVSMPGHARWRGALSSAQVLVAQVHEEMQSYYDARSEVWQEGEQGSQFLERQEQVEALLSQLGELL